MYCQLLLDIYIKCWPYIAERILCMVIMHRSPTAAGRNSNEWFLTSQTSAPITSSYTLTALDIYYYIIYKLRVGEKK